MMERELPARYLAAALSLLVERQGRTVVELGSMRYPLGDPLGQLDGHSTLFWALAGLDVVSADNDARATEITTQATAAFRNVTAVTMDAHDFLAQSQTPIDLLYLDAWDVGTPGYQEHHLAAYFAALPRLQDRSLVLVDDTDLIDGGKGALIGAAAHQHGFRIVFRGRQTLFARCPA